MSEVSSASTKIINIERMCLNVGMFVHWCFGHSRMQSIDPSKPEVGWEQAAKILMNAWEWCFVWCLALYACLHVQHTGKNRYCYGIVCHFRNMIIQHRTRPILHIVHRFLVWLMTTHQLHKTPMTWCLSKIINRTTSFRIRHRLKINNVCLCVDAPIRAHL